MTRKEMTLHLKDAFETLKKVRVGLKDSPEQHGYEIAFAASVIEAQAQKLRDDLVEAKQITDDLEYYV